MALMTLKPRIRDPRATDDISQVLKSIVWAPRVLDDGKPETPEQFAERLQLPLGYLTPYYPDGLRERILGPNARELVSVSRYYPTLDPPVVVDFEPAPPDPWFLDVKQQFFFERGVLFLAIYLQDRLTPEQFAERYREALRVVNHKEVQQDLATVATVDVEGILSEPGLLTLVDARSRQLVTETRDSLGRLLQGAARMHVLKRVKTELVAQLRGQLRNGMDRDECYRQLTDATQRPSDRQVGAPVAGRSGA